MDYGDFTLANLRQRFQLVLDATVNLFADVRELDLPTVLIDTLARCMPLAVNVNTE